MTKLETDVSRAVATKLASIGEAFLGKVKSAPGMRGEEVLNRVQGGFTGLLAGGALGGVIGNSIGGPIGAGIGAGIGGFGGSRLMAGLIQALDSPSKNLAMRYGKTLAEAKDPRLANKMTDYEKYLLGTQVQNSPDALSIIFRAKNKLPYDRLELSQGQDAAYLTHKYMGQRGEDLGASAGIISDKSDINGLLPNIEELNKLYPMDTIAHDVRLKGDGSTPLQVLSDVGGEDLAYAAGGQLIKSLINPLSYIGL